VLKNKTNLKEVTSASVLPRRSCLLGFDFLLNLGFLINVVEVVDDDGDGKGDAEDSADCANLGGKVPRRCPFPRWCQAIRLLVIHPKMA